MSPKAVWAIGGGLLLASVLYAPHVYETSKVRIPAGYGWIFDPPSRCVIDTDRLLVEWVGILALVAVLYFFTRSKKAGGDA